MTVTVLTPSVPKRAGMLAEAVASVNAQTVRPKRHLILVDHEHEGIVPTMNALLATVQTEWFCVLADDDLLYPDHLALLLGAASEMVDVVWSWCDVEGVEWNVNRGREFDEQALRADNYIPGGGPLVNTHLARLVGGWKERGIPEDWGLWIDLLDAGGVFRCVPKVTWRYRVHGDNLSRRGLTEIR